MDGWMDGCTDRRMDGRADIGLQKLKTYRNKSMAGFMHKFFVS